MNTIVSILKKVGNKLNGALTGILKGMVRLLDKMKENNIVRNVPGFRSWVTWKMTIATCFYVLIALMIICPNLDSNLQEQKWTMADRQAAYSGQSAAAQANTNKMPEFTASDFEVKVDIQDLVDSKNRTKTVVTLKNNSEYNIAGNVKVLFKDAANNTVGSDVMYVENLSAGDSTFAIMWIKDAKTVTSTKPSIHISKASK